MSPSNKLFVLSVILVPVLLISISHAEIYNYYTYSLPLNDLKIIRSQYGLESFQVVQNREGSTCFTTPSQNHFCYSKPRMHENGAISYVGGSNGVEGEIHFDPVNTGIFYFTIKNMTKINDKQAMITLADKNYRVGNEDTILYEITEKFEYSRIIKKFDTFVSHCTNKGTDAIIVQYLGTKTINGTDYFVTWHTNANSTNGIKCDYPQIIQYSFGHDFRSL